MVKSIDVVDAAPNGEKNRITLKKVLFLIFYRNWLRNFDLVIMVK